MKVPLHVCEKMLQDGQPRLKLEHLESFSSELQPLWLGMKKSLCSKNTKKHTKRWYKIIQQKHTKIYKSTESRKRREKKTKKRTYRGNELQRWLSSVVGGPSQHIVICKQAEKNSYQTNDKKMITLQYTAYFRCGSKRSEEPSWGHSNMISVK